MAYNKTAKSIAPTIIKRYKPRMKNTRQPTTPMKSKTPEFVSAKRALNNMTENYPYFTPNDKKRILSNLVKAIKRTR